MQQGTLNQLVAIYHEVMFGHGPVNTMPVLAYCEYNSRLTRQRSKLQAAIHSAAMNHDVSLPGPVTKALARVVQAKAVDSLGRVVSQSQHPSGAKAVKEQDYETLALWLSTAGRQFCAFMKEWESAFPDKMRVRRQLSGRKLTTHSIRTFNWTKFALAVYLSAAQDRKQQEKNRVALRALADALEDATFSIAYANRQPDKVMEAIKTLISRWEDLLSETIRYYSAVSTQDIQKFNAVYQAWAAISANKPLRGVVYSLITEHPIPYLAETLDDSVMGSIQPNTVVGYRWLQPNPKKTSKVRELFYSYAGAPLKFDQYPGVHTHLEMWRTKTQAAQLHQKEQPHDRFKPLLGETGLTDVEAQALKAKIRTITKEHIEECNKERFNKLAAYRPSLGY